MGSCLRSKIINLSMDIEDIYGDADILNNLLKDFVFFLINQKISCDLYITGVTQRDAYVTSDPSNQGKEPQNEDEG